jgi:hypothetical protein
VRGFGRRLDLELDRGVGFELRLDLGGLERLDRDVLDLDLFDLEIRRFELRRGDVFDDLRGLEARRDLFGRRELDVRSRRRLRSL